MWQAQEGGQSVFILMVTRSDGWTCRPPTPSRATTDAEGNFVLTDVECGDVELRVGWLSQDASDSRLLPEWRQRVTVRAGETTHLEIHMARGAAVEGVVRQSDGRPAAGVEVRAVDGEGFLGRWARTDSAGAYRIAGLNAGELTLTANERSDLGHAPLQAKLGVADGATGTWDVTLPKAALLAGIAIGEDWKGLAGWSVFINLPSKAGYEWSKTTDADGRFQLEAAAGESYDLQLTPPGSDHQALPHAWVQGARPGDEIVLEVSDASRPSAVVRGVLRGPDGAPPQGGHAALSRAGFPPVHVTAKPSPNDGRFELGPVPPGPYLMSTASADISSDSKLVELEPNEVLDVGVLQQKSPGEVTVRVRLPEGKSSEGVTIALEGQGERRELDRLASGAWRSRKVPAGLLTLIVEAPGCAQARRDLQLEEKGSLEVEVELVRGAACPVLVVLPPSAQGATWVTLRVLDEAGAIQQVLSRSTDGSQPIEGLLLPAGEWRVEAQESNESWRGTAQVTIQAVDRALPVLAIALEPPR
jgi:hypothetical protein